MSKTLPKWPQCLIYGKPVTKVQAIEMIALTDSFFMYASGNDRRHIRKVYNDCGFDIEVNDSYLGYPEMPDDALWKINQERGFLNLDYLSTNWISSSSIYGPHGWVNPDGTIAHTLNIGKWPQVDEVEEELTLIAARFPFLEMTVVLMDAEECEDSKNPVVSFNVSNGKCVLNENPTQVELNYVMNAYNVVDPAIFNFALECGLNAVELQQVVDLVKPHVTKFYDSQVSS